MGIAASIHLDRFLLKKVVSKSKNKLLEKTPSQALDPIPLQEILDGNLAGASEDELDEDLDLEPAEEAHMEALKDIEDALDEEGGNELEVDLEPENVAGASSVEEAISDSD